MYSMNYQTGLNYTNSIQKSITGEMQKLRLPATVLWALFLVFFTTQETNLIIKVNYYFIFNIIDDK